MSDPAKSTIATKTGHADQEYTEESKTHTVKPPVETQKLVIEEGGDEYVVTETKKVREEEGRGNVTTSVKGWETKNQWIEKDDPQVKLVTTVMQEVEDESAKLKKKDTIDLAKPAEEVPKPKEDAPQDTTVPEKKLVKQGSSTLVRQGSKEIPHYMLPQNRDYKEKEVVIPERKHFVDRTHSRVEETVKGPKEPVFQDKEGKPEHEAHPTEAKHIPQDRELKHSATAHGEIKERLGSKDKRTGSKDKLTISRADTKTDAGRRGSFRADEDDGTGKKPATKNSTNTTTTTTKTTIPETERKRRAQQILTISIEILTLEQKNIIKRLRDVGYEKLTPDEKDKLDKIYEHKKGLIIETTAADEERKPRVTRLLTITMGTFTFDERTVIKKLKEQGYEKLTNDEKDKLDKMYETWKQHIPESNPADQERRKKVVKLITLTTTILTTFTVDDRTLVEKLKAVGYDKLSEDEKAKLEKIYEAKKETLETTPEAVERKRRITKLIKTIKVETLTTTQRRVFEKLRDSGYESLEDEEKDQLETIYEERKAEIEADDSEKVTSPAKFGAFLAKREATLNSLASILTNEERDALLALRRLTPGHEHDGEDTAGDKTPEQKEIDTFNLIANFINQMTPEEQGVFDRLQEFRMSDNTTLELSEKDVEILKKFGINPNYKVTIVQGPNGPIPHYMLPQNRDYKEKEVVIPERKHFVDRTHSRVEETVKGPKEPVFQDKEGKPEHEAHPTEAKHIPQDRELKHSATAHGEIKERLGSKDKRTGSKDKLTISRADTKTDAGRRGSFRADEDDGTGKKPATKNSTNTTTTTTKTTIPETERKRRAQQILTISIEILTLEQKNIIKRLRDVGYEKLTPDEKDKLDKIYEHKKGLIIETTAADEERKPRVTRLLTITMGTFTFDERTVIKKLKEQGYEKLTNDEKDKLDKMYETWKQHIPESNPADQERRKKVVKLITLTTTILTTFTVDDRTLVEKLKAVGYDKLSEDEKAKLEKIYEAKKETLETTPEAVERKRRITKLIKTIKVETLTTTQRRVFEKLRDSGYESLEDEEKDQLETIYEERKAEIEADDSEKVTSPAKFGAFLAKREATLNSLASILTNEERDALLALRRLTPGHEHDGEDTAGDKTPEQKEIDTFNLIANFINQMTPEEQGVFDRLQEFRMSDNTTLELSEKDVEILKKFGINPNYKVTIVQGPNGPIPHYMLPQNRDYKEKEVVIPERKHFVDRTHSRVEETVKGPKEPVFQDKEGKPEHEAHPTEAKHIPQDRELKHSATAHGEIKERLGSKDKRTGSKDKLTISRADTKTDAGRRGSFRADEDDGTGKKPATKNSTNTTTTTTKTTIPETERKRRAQQILTISIEILTLEQKNIIKRLRDVGYEKLTPDEKDKLDKIYEHKKGLIIETTAADEERKPRVTRLLTITMGTFTFDERTVIKKLKEQGYEKLTNDEKDKLDKMYETWKQHIPESNPADQERRKKVVKLITLTTTILTTFTVDDRTLVEKLKAVGYDKLSEDEKAKLEKIYEAKKETLETTPEAVERKRRITKLIKTIKVETLTTTQRRVFEKLRDSGYESLEDEEKDQLETIYEERKAEIEADDSEKVTSPAKFGAFLAKREATLNSLASILTNEERDALLALRRLTPGHEHDGEDTAGDKTPEQKEIDTFNLIANFINQMTPEEQGVFDRLQEFRMSDNTTLELSEKDVEILKKFGINPNYKVTIVQGPNGPIPHYMLPQNRDYKEKEVVIPERKHFVDRTHSRVEETVKGPKEPVFQDKEGKPEHEAHPTEAKHIPQDRELKHSATAHGEIKERLGSKDKRTGSKDKLTISRADTKTDAGRRGSFRADEDDGTGKKPATKNSTNTTTTTTKTTIPETERKRRAQQILTISIEILTLEQKNIIKRLRDVGYEKLTPDEKDKLDKIYEHKKGLIIETTAADEERKPRVTRLLTITMGTFTFDERTVIKKLKEQGYEKLTNDEKDKLDKMYETWKQHIPESNPADQERRKKVVKLITLTTTILTTFTVDDRTLVEKLKAVGYDKLSEDEKAKLEKIYEAKKETLETTPEAVERKRRITKLIKTIKVETLTTTQRRVFEKLRDSGYESLEDEEKDQLETIYEERKAEIEADDSEKVTSPAKFGAFLAKREATLNSLASILTNEERDALLALRRLTPGHEHDGEDTAGDKTPEQKEIDTFNLIANFINQMTPEEQGVFDRLQEFRMSDNTTLELSEKDVEILKKFGINPNYKVTIVQGPNGPIPHYMLPQNRDYKEKEVVIPERKHFVDRTHSRVEETVKGPKEPVFQDKEGKPEHEAHPTEAKHIPQDRELKHSATAHGEIKERLGSKDKRTGSKDKLTISRADTKTDAGRRGSFRADEDDGTGKKPATKNSTNTTTTTTKTTIPETERKRRAQQILTISIEILTLEQKNIIKRLRDVGYEKLTPDEKDKLDKIYEHKKGLIIETTAADEERKPRVTRLLTITMGTFTFDERTVIKKLKEQGYEKLTNDEKDKLDKMYETWKQHIPESNPADQERRKKVVKLITLTTTILTTFTVDDRTLVEKLKAVGYDKLSEDEKAKLEKIYEAKKETLETTPEAVERKRRITKLIKTIKVETLTTTQRRVFEKLRDSGYESLEDEEKDQLETIYEERKAEIEADDSEKVTSPAKFGAFLAKREATLNSLASILTNEERDALLALRRLTPGHEHDGEDTAGDKTPEQKEIDTFNLIANFINQMTPEEQGVFDRLQEFRMSDNTTLELSEKDVEILKKFGINPNYKVTIVQGPNGPIPHYMLPQNRDYKEKEVVIPERKHFVDRTHSRVEETVKGPKEPVFQDKEGKPEHEAHPTEAKHIPQDRELKHSATAHGEIKERLGSKDKRTGSKDKLTISRADTKTDAGRRGSFRADEDDGTGKKPATKNSTNTTTTTTKTTIPETERKRRAQQILTISIEILTLEQKNIIKRLRDVGYEKLTPDEKDKLDKIYEHKKGLIIETTAADEERKPRVTRLLTITMGTFTFDERTVIKKLKEQGYEKLTNDEKDKLDKMYETWKQHIPESNPADQERRKKVVKLITLTTTILTTFTVDDRTLVEKLKAVGYDKLSEDEKAKLEKIYEAKKETLETTPEAVERKRRITKLIKTIKVETLTTTQRRVFEKLRDSGYESLEDEEKDQLETIYEERKAEIEADDSEKVTSPAKFGAFLAKREATLNSLASILTNEERDALLALRRLTPGHEHDGEDTAGDKTPEQKEIDTFNLIANFINQMTPEEQGVFDRLQEFRMSDNTTLELSEKDVEILKKFGINPNYKVTIVQGPNGPIPHYMLPQNRDYKEKEVVIPERKHFVDRTHSRVEETVKGPKEPVFQDKEGKPEHEAHPTEAKHIPQDREFKHDCTVHEVEKKAVVTHEHHAPVPPATHEHIHGHKKEQDKVVEEKVRQVEDTTTKELEKVEEKAPEKAPEPVKKVEPAPVKTEDDESAKRTSKLTTQTTSDMTRTEHHGAEQQIEKAKNEKHVEKNITKSRKVEYEETPDESIETTTTITKIVKKTEVIVRNEDEPIEGDAEDLELESEALQEVERAGAIEDDGTTNTKVTRKVIKKEFTEEFEDEGQGKKVSGGNNDKESHSKVVKKYTKVEEEEGSDADIETTTTVTKSVTNNVVKKSAQGGTTPREAREINRELEDMEKKNSKNVQVSEKVDDDGNVTRTKVIKSSVIKTSSSQIVEDDDTHGANSRKITHGEPKSNTTTVVTRRPIKGPNGEEGEEIIEETITETETVTETTEEVEEDEQPQTQTRKAPVTSGSKTSVQKPSSTAVNDSRAPGSNTKTTVTRRPVKGPNGEEGEEIIEETVTETVTETETTEEVEETPKRVTKPVNTSSSTSKTSTQKSSSTTKNDVIPGGNTRTVVTRRPIKGPNGEEGEEIIEETITETETVTETTEEVEEDEQPQTQTRKAPVTSGSKTSVQKSSSTVVNDSRAPGSNTKTTVTRRPVKGPNGEEGEEIIEETVTETVTETETTEEVEETPKRVSKPVTSSSTTSKTSTQKSSSMVGESKPANTSSSTSKTSMQKSSSTTTNEVNPGSSTKTTTIRRPINNDDEEGEEIIEETITETITETTEEVEDEGVKKPAAKSNAQKSSTTKSSVSEQKSSYNDQKTSGSKTIGSKVKTAAPQEEDDEEITEEFTETITEEITEEDGSGNVRSKVTNPISSQSQSKSTKTGGGNVGGSSYKEESTSYTSTGGADKARKVIDGGEGKNRVENKKNESDTKKYASVDEDGNDVETEETTETVTTTVEYDVDEVADKK